MQQIKNGDAPGPLVVFFYGYSTHSFFFHSFSISCPFLFLITVFRFSCLGSRRASRQALGPAALGYGEGKITGRFWIYGFLDDSSILTKAMQFNLKKYFWHDFLLNHLKMVILIFLGKVSYL